MRLSQTLNDDVDEVLVEGDPGLGAFGGGLSAVRLDLDEVRDWPFVAIERFVERAVDAQWLSDANRADRRPAVIVAGDDVRRDRRSRCIRRHIDRLCGGRRGRRCAQRSHREEHDDANPQNRVPSHRAGSIEHGPVRVAHCWKKAWVVVTNARPCSAVPHPGTLDHVPRPWLL